MRHWSDEAEVEEFSEAMLTIFAAIYSLGFFPGLSSFWEHTVMEINLTLGSTHFGFNSEYKDI